MPVAPLHDSDVETLLTTWEDGLHAVSALGRSLDHRGWDAPTECPGWSAGDVVRHLCWVEQFLSGAPLPSHEPDWSRLPHVTSDFGRITETGVDTRRADPPARTCDELDEWVAVRKEQLRSVQPFALDTPVPGLWGKPVPLQHLLRMRCFDTWTHEQDIRRAVRRPGGLAAPGAQVSAAQMVAALPFVLAKSLSAPAGDSLRVVVDGEVTFAATARVDDTGRGVPADDVAAPTVTLQTDWETFARLCAGRLDVAATTTLTAVTVVGDAPWAAALLTELAVTP